MAQLTRQEMEAIIKRGESVLYQGQIITRVEQLPSEADLAEGDPDKEAIAAAAIEQQIAALQGQLNRLTARGTSPTLQPPAATTQPPSTSSTNDQPPTQTDALADFPELTVAGYDLEKVRQASDDELLAVPGIGPAKLKQIRKATA